MKYLCLFGICAIILAGCGGGQVDLSPVEPSEYYLNLEMDYDIDTSLVSTFNTQVYDDRIPTVTRFSRSVSFPDAMPGILVLSHRFEADARTEKITICYDSTAGRFHPMVWTGFKHDFNGMVEGRFGDQIDASKAFDIAAVAVYLFHKPKLIVCREADIFLMPRLRDYVNKTYPPISGEVRKESITEWWTWYAFPIANNEYRNFYNAYLDSLKAAEFLKEIPETAYKPPSVEKSGLFYVVTMYGVVSSVSNELVRFKVILGENGRVDKIEADVSYYL